MAQSARHRYCEDCARRQARKRRKSRGKPTGKTAERGYGAKHQKLRKQWSERVATGMVSCFRCGLLIDPRTPWDLGHDDHDRDYYTGPEHRACNRATAGRRKKTKRTARIW